MSKQLAVFSPDFTAKDGDVITVSKASGLKIGSFIDATMTAARQSNLTWEIKNNPNDICIKFYRK